MIRILSILITLGMVGMAQARTQEMPPSFSLPESNQVVQKYTLDKVDTSKTKQQDYERESRGLPPRFALKNKVKISPKNAGTWTALSANQSLWRLRVASDEAKSLNLAFTNFYLPTSAKLFLYAADRTQVRGPFNFQDNNVKRQLWTPIIRGSEMFVELVVNNDQKDKVHLEMTQVNHGYRHFGERTQLQEAGSCNIDVKCPESNGWEEQVRSVAVISTGGQTFCTGFLVNNTNNDNRPLFMTANHCFSSDSQATSLVAYWNFEQSSCRGAGNSGSGGNGELDQFTTGATLLATGAASDFTIVEFNSEIDPEFNVFYAGWDARDLDPSMSVAIHHPSTDEKSISFENDPLTTTGYLSETEDDRSHIRVEDWDVGTTEPGSSGSPLFNQDKRIVGQLHGGRAACGNDLADWYGKFSYSWGAGLKEVLDPGNTGNEFIDGIDTETDYRGVLSLIDVTGTGINGQADPGESLTIRMLFENTGIQALSNVNFVVTTANQNVTIVDGNQSIASVSSGNQQEIVFKAEIDPTFLCGDKLELQVEYTYQGQSRTYPLSFETGIPNFLSQLMSPALSIPDADPTGVTSELEMFDTSAISGLEVEVNLTHTYIGDLKMTLVSPNGTSVMLHDLAGGGSEDIIGRYPTSLSPAQSLDRFNGESLAGTWKLEISDNAGQDLGVLNSWGLHAVTGFTCE